MTEYLKPSFDAEAPGELGMGYFYYVYSIWWKIVLYRIFFIHFCETVTYSVKLS